MRGRSKKLEKLRFWFELFLKKYNLPHIPLYLKKLGNYGGYYSSYLRLRNNKSWEPIFILSVILHENTIVDRWRDGKDYSYWVKLDEWIKLETNEEKTLFTLFHEIGHYYHLCKYPNTFRKYIGTTKLEDFADIIANKLYREYIKDQKWN